MNHNPAVINGVAGRALPFPGNDVDTDRIIPARFLRSVTFEGLGEQVFRDERFREDGSPKDHPFNEERFKGAEILLVNRNFGCGSSREHAPQAIMRFGIKAIVGESFAEIFAGNCTSLGIPVCTVDEATIRDLQNRAHGEPQTRFEIDIEACTITYADKTVSCNMSPSARTALLNGTWNTLDELLLNEEAIEAVHARLPIFSVME